MEQINSQYDFIRNEYPEISSQDQFYRIAHISKATALYLLQSGKVPCVDSGKKTRKYKIYTKDVMQYMIDRERHPFKYKADRGWYTHRSRSTARKNHKRQAVFVFDYSALSKKNKANLRSFITDSLENYPDLLTAKDLSEHSGYSLDTIRRWLQKGDVKSLRSGTKYLVPKVYWIDYLCSDCAMNQTMSAKHIELLKSFQIAHKIGKRVC